MDLAITKPLAYYNSCFLPDNEHVTFGLEPEVSSKKNEIPRSSRRMTVMQSAFPALLLIQEDFFFCIQLDYYNLLKIKTDP